jgi:Cyclin-dependent kinase inhibitor 3 (CDKN3)
MSAPSFQSNRRPNESTYWVTDSVMAGAYPGEKSGDEAATSLKIESFLDAGITHFINLTHLGELPEYSEIAESIGAKMGQVIVHQRYAVPDYGLPSKELMNEILDAVDAAVNEGNGKVFIHCHGGTGRTGTVVGCFLARHGASGSEALDKIALLFKSSGMSKKYPRSPETDKQRDFVSNWK